MPKPKRSETLRHEEKDQPIIIKETTPGICSIPFIPGVSCIVTPHEKGTALYVNKEIREKVKAVLKKAGYRIIKD